MRGMTEFLCAWLAVAMAAAVARAQQPPAGREAAEGPADLPKTVDLRPQLISWGLMPRSQGVRNTCSVFVTAEALEFAVSKRLARGTPLSVEYLNWACNQAIRNETADRGQFFHDLLKGFEAHGICPEADMPYRKQFDPAFAPSGKAAERAGEIRRLGLQVHWIHPWKPKPGLTDDHLRQIKGVLARGYPVAAGSSHSRLLVGYADDARQPGGGLFLTEDSGIAAFDSISYAFAKEKVGDVFWVEAPSAPPAKE